ncbi:MAG: type II secretion system protein [Candidatus Eremiobacteraeota bacterium]|nr:type II secretion system protein [Candidatus Eremiobacteraeota bacterium]MBC5828143.1 type II secretion system protein [Candidatus Eremiobacteraeota bacterium]
MKRRGFTIVELLIAMGILGLILTLSISEFSLVVRHFSKTSADLDAERSARNMMARVQKEVRQAMPQLSFTGGAGSPCDAIVPQASPGASPSPTPAPTPTSEITCWQADDVSSSDPTKQSGHYDKVTINLSATAPPGRPAANRNLMMTKTDYNGNVGTPVVMGLDVTNFSVTPKAQNVFDIAITVDPVRRADMTNPPGPFTLQSSAFISYYKTN